MNDSRSCYIHRTCTLLHMFDFAEIFGTLKSQVFTACIMISMISFTETSAWRSNWSCARVRCTCKYWLGLLMWYHERERKCKSQEASSRCTVNLTNVTQRLLFRAIPTERSCRNEPSIDLQSCRSANDRLGAMPDPSKGFSSGIPYAWVEERKRTYLHIVAA